MNVFGSARVGLCLGPSRAGRLASRQTNSPGLALQGLVVTQLDIQPGECIKVKGKILYDAKG